MVSLEELGDFHQPEVYYFAVFVGGIDRIRVVGKMCRGTIVKLGSSSGGAGTELLGLHSCPYFEGGRLDLAAAGHWYLPFDIEG